MKSQNRILFHAKEISFSSEMTGRNLIINANRPHEELHTMSFQPYNTENNFKNVVIAKFWTWRIKKKAQIIVRKVELFCMTTVMDTCPYASVQAQKIHTKHDTALWFELYTLGDKDMSVSVHQLRQMQSSGQEMCEGKENLCTFLSILLWT